MQQEDEMDQFNIAAQMTGLSGMPIPRTEIEYYRRHSAAPWNLRLVAPLLVTLSAFVAALTLLSPHS